MSSKPAEVDAASHSIGWATTRHFWASCWQFKRGLILVSLTAVSSLCLSTFIPLLISKTLAALTRPASHPTHYIPLLIIVSALGIMANFIGFNAFFRLQAKVMTTLEEEALAALLARSVGFHNNHVAGKLIADASDYSSTFNRLSGAVVTNIIPFVLSIVIGIGAVMLNSWLLGLVVLAMTVAIIVMAIYQTVRRTPNRTQRHTARRTMISHLADSVSNVQTIKTFAREPYELRQLHRNSTVLQALRIRDWVSFGQEGTLRIGVLLGFEILCLAVIIHLVAQRPALLGIGIFTFNYAIGLTNKLFDIGTTFRTVEDALLDASDMTTIITTTPEVLDAKHAQALHTTDGAISFDDVVFQYTDSNAPESVFENLSLDIAAGQKVGLVGPSGGGKSTLTRILLRFEDLQGGSIRIDGQDIAAITQSSLRQAIAYVPQEPLLFHRSIRENIAYGNPAANLQTIQAAADKASAREFIEALPNGFDTIVGERGVKLSGGQRQRIAIARAILKDAPILVLDEATSALDSESEAAIQSALHELIRGRTTLVIAHRLSTIQKMDRILVLEQGTIVEDGSHEALLKQKGLYARLWQRQSGGFIED